MGTQARGHFPESDRADFGYPSNVQRDDGMVVTAYYEGFRNKEFGKPGNYRMCAVIWDPTKTRK